MNSPSKIFKIGILALIAFTPFWLSAQTISVNISVNQPTCFDWTNGDATATATGGTAPYSYRWSNGQGGGQTMSGVRAGDYVVTVTDATNRQTTQSFTVGQPALLVPAVNVIGNSCDAGASYLGSGSGGIAPYTYSWRELASGQITIGATISSPSIGSYHLSVTDSKGCTMTKVVNVKPVKLMVIPKEATCGGACDGSAEAWVDGGTPPYTYQWSTGATTGIIGPVRGGDYTVTVTDAWGCVKVATGTVFEPGILAPNLAVSGQCTGSATATVNPTGGRAPLTIRWSTGATGNTVTNLQQGQYSVSIIDSKGCLKDTVFKISSGFFGLSITKSDANCSNIASGSANINVTGGNIGDYSYLWNNGATSPNISNIVAGTYTVTVTDGAKCTNSLSTTIQSVGSLVLQTTSANTACGTATGSVSVTNVTGGSAPYSYRWSNGATTPSVSNLRGGSYTVTVTDANGCSAINTVNVQSSGSLNITLSSNASSCGSATGSANVSAVSGGTEPYTYKWSNNATTQTLTNIGVGVYTVTVTDAGGCSSSRSVEVQGINNMQLTLSDTKADCGGSNGTATVTNITGGVAPYTYRWSTGATTASVSGLGIGSFTVTVTDATNCSTVATAVVNANSNLVLSTTSTATTCGGATGTATITNVTGGVAPFTYQWQNGATTSTASGLAAGLYTVTVTDARGCTRFTSISVPSTGNFNVSTNITPAGCSAATGSATISNVTGGNAPYSYVWSTNATGQTASSLAPGSYSVTITDATGCTAVFGPITVGIGTPSVATPTLKNATCGKPNGQIGVALTGGTAPFTYSWSDLANATNQPKDRTGLAAGTYSVQIKDAGGCVTTLSNLSLIDTGSIQARYALQPQGCSPSGDSVIMRFTNNTIIHSASATYSWWFTGDRASNVGSPEMLFGTVQGESRVIARSAEGCVDTLFLRFPVDVIKVAIADTIPTCLNSRISITATNQNPNFSPKYKWSNGDTTSTTGVTPTLSGLTQLFVTITNSYGCTKKDTVNIITVSNLNSADLSWKRSCEAAKVSFFNTNTNNNQWRWVFGDPANPTAGSFAANPTYTYSNPGTFTVTVIPTGLNCLNTVTLQVIAPDKPAVSIKAGNDTTVCNENRVTLSALSSANTYEWSNTPNFATIASTSANYQVTPANGSNAYYVRSKTSDGCIATDTIVITDHAIKINSIGSLAVCSGSDKVFNIKSQNTGDRLYVRWSPTSLISGFTGGDSLSPIVRTSTDGSLIGSYTNQFGCTLNDTIAIKASKLDATVTADNKIIYDGDKAVLTAGPTGTGYTYKWSPSGALTTTSSSITVANPTQTTTYTVTVTDAAGCVDTAQIALSVLSPQCAEPYIFIPRAFTPNGDGKNDVVYVRGEYLTTLEFVIYNRWGEEVFTTTDKNIGWDGKFNGQPVTPDVYGYYVKGTCQKGEQFFKKGNITVLR